jgi:hypothetical protein
MLLGKEEKYMEIVSAELVQTKTETEKKFFINIDELSVSIPISDSNANVVKSAFNALIHRLKEGEFNIVLKGNHSGLFYHVAVEYIEQLNKELSEVYKEMDLYGFIDSTIGDI